MSAVERGFESLPDHRLIGELQERGYTVEDADGAPDPRRAGGPIELVAAGDVAADNLNLLVGLLERKGWAVTKEYQGPDVVVFNAFPGGGDG